MAYYQSPRWSNEIADCSMPMTFDTYSNCSFGCLYCFSQFQRAIGGAKENYLAKEVKNVNPEKIKNMCRDPDKYAGQFAPYIKQRKVMQWGGAVGSVRRLRAQVWRDARPAPLLQGDRLPALFFHQGNMVYRG